MAVDVFGKNSIKSRASDSLLVGGSGHPFSFQRNWFPKKPQVKLIRYRVGTAHNKYRF